MIYEENCGIIIKKHHVGGRETPASRRRGSVGGEGLHFD